VVTPPGNQQCATAIDDSRREYVITRPDTPLPWINYLGTGTFFGIISNTAGGYSCYRDARLRRITRYRDNSVPADSGGRYLYLPDNRSGAYWSPSWQPTQPDLDHYECRHGLSCTQITSAYLGVRAETLYFVRPARPSRCGGCGSAMSATSRPRCPCSVGLLPLAPHGAVVQVEAVVAIPG
jgi:cellobiose phosphorylase